MNILPESVLDYLGEKHTTIIHGYKDSHGLIESCGLIAQEIASILEREGLQSNIIKIRPREGNNLRPKIEGNITWGGHLVCSYNDFILDPLLGKPILKNEYPQAVFGEDILMM